MRYINVNTDASYDKDYMIGGYAFWIRSDSFVVKQCGLLKGNPRTSTDAELMAIEYAMKILLAQPCYSKSYKVAIFTDCLAAIGKILRPKTDLDRRVQKLWRKLTTKQGEASLTHVRSHTQRNDIASSLNDWCDKNAKKELRKKIDYIKNKQQK